MMCTSVDNRGSESEQSICLILQNGEILEKFREIT